MASAPDASLPLPSAGQRTILGHPPGLCVLFLTQMWERFSYFGMVAYLVLYLNRYFKLPQEETSTIYKWYTSGIFFAPLLGGYLAARCLGNKPAVLIGLALMAVGHFLMAFPTLPATYAALLFLVVGFGLLTPPLTTQVGLLYSPTDPRRDSAYTIFYMGINLGAFVSPLLCGWLVDNTRGGFHSAFTLAGIGMVIGLVTYLVGFRWVVEIDQGPTGPTPDPSGEPDQPARPAGDAGPLSEKAVRDTPSVWPAVNRLAPGFLAGLGVLLALAAPVLVWRDWLSWDTLVFMELAAVCALVFAWMAAQVRQALRDRVLAIMLLLVFSVFYWGGGQYGNAINLWADQNTDRYLGSEARPPELYPGAAEGTDAAAEETAPQGFWERWTTMFQLLPRKQSDQSESWAEWWAKLWNPIPSGWFQSVNPLMILLVAPLFAMLWTRLGRHGLNPSIPVKMALGLLLMTLAFALLLGAARGEAGATSVPVKGARLPESIAVNEQGQVCRLEPDKTPVAYDAGRLVYDRSSHTLRAVGVLPDLVRDEIVRRTAPADFVAKVEELKKNTEEAATRPAGWRVQVMLDRVPPGFDLRYAGFGKETGNRAVNFDPATRIVTATIVLEDKEIKGLRVAAGDPELRATLDDLMVKANSHRVSPWWLIGFFLLATMGEMCVAPVGMSMISQLAPARFVPMMMGFFLLTFAFGNFLAGAFGEKWGTWAPIPYFLVVLAVLGSATLLLALLVRKVAALMHGAA